MGLLAGRAPGRRQLTAGSVAISSGSQLLLGCAPCLAFCSFCLKRENPCSRSLCRGFASVQRFPCLQGLSASAKVL